MQNTIKGLILDIDGVVWHDKIPIGNLKEIFDHISSMGFKYTFATNNSTRAKSTYQSHLTEIGIPVTENQIITSGSLAAETLAKIFPSRGEVFIIGMDGLTQAMHEAGFFHGNKEPLAVVVGLDENFDYQNLLTASNLIRAGIPFYGTNPDITLPTPTGLHPGTGSILAAIEAASSIKPLILGKPKPAMFQIALDRMSLKPTHTLVIGDRLETDIAGGQAAGCKVGLVLSGVTNSSQANSWDPAIDIIAEDLETLVKGLANG